MPDPIPDQFELLRPEGRRGEKFDEAISALRAGVEASEIRKVVLDEVKFTLGRAVENAWDKHVQEPFFFSGRYRDQPDAVLGLQNTINMSSLHDCLATAKKIERSGLEGPVIDAMKAIMTEALPLAQATRDLKDHVIKGRAPNPNPPPENPDKEIGTCSCCMRGIAVATVGMAHHGYQRPGTGQQTSSCSGVRFPPLEVSTEGLEWFIGATRTHFERLADRIANAGSLTEIRWTERDRGSPSGFAHKVCTVDDPDWPRVHKRHVAALGAESVSTWSQLGYLEGELVKWQAFHAPTPQSEDEPSPGIS